MSQETFHISDRKINNQIYQKIPRLGVEAWDKDLVFNDLVSST